MRSDIVPGGVFPDYTLPDHTNTVRMLSELQGNDPLVLTLARGHYCPKEHQQHLELAAHQAKFAVAYAQIVTISTDDHHTLQEFRASVGAQWTFLSDPGRIIQKDLDIQVYTDPDNNPMIPHTLVLKPGLIVHSIYMGYWYWGRPSFYDLWHDLREVSREVRPTGTSASQGSAKPGTRAIGRSSTAGTGDPANKQTQDHSNWSQHKEFAMQGSFRVGMIAGIDIRIHYTWILALFLIAWSLALGYFPMSDRSAGPLTYWLLGIVGAILLFASVLLHELGHSLVSRSRGLRVDNITLFIFGGVSNITREPTTARDEFSISVVGPVISLVLAAVFWLLGRLLLPDSAAGAVAGYLAYANLLLGLFNIVPGFPLDGGRVLRSIIWAVTGQMSRATQIATYIGQGVAWLLIGWGIVDLLGGDVFGGLWIAFIGWFLNNGAEASRQEAAVSSALTGVPLTSVMDASPEFVSPALTVLDFVLEHAMRRGQRALPVVNQGELVGIVSITDAKHLNQDAWPSTNVGQIMTRMPLKSLGPSADLASALQLMVENSVHQVPIVDDGGLVGMVSRTDVMRYLHAGIALRGGSPTPTEVVAPAHTPVASRG